MSKNLETHRSPVSRCYGSETEYGHTRSDAASSEVSSVAWPKGYPHLEQFAANGGRLYPDVGFPEYATPECSSLEELVAHEAAGDKLAREAMRRACSRLQLHKRAVSPAHPEYTNGYHENYATDIDVWSDERPASLYNRQALLAHLATRYLLIGAGTAVSGDYTVAQKIHGLRTEVGDDTISQKTLLNTRNRPYTGGTDTPLKRLHITSGDPNISPQALRLKFGSTSCVLRLLEHGYSMEDVFLEDSLVGALTSGGPLELANQSLQLQNGQKATPLEIQERLLHKARELSEHIPLPEDELDVLEIWQDTLDALQRYYATGDVTKPLQQLDWFSKYEFMETSHKPAAAIDLGYDKLQEGIGYKLRRNGYRYAPYAVSESDRETAMTQPPRTRAQLRGGLVVAAYRYLQAHPSEEEMQADWGYFIHNGYNHSLGPPNRTYEPEEVEAFSYKLGLI